MTMLVRGLGHLSFRVPNFDESFAHATQILGLREVARSGSTVYLTNNASHHTLELTPSDRASLDHIGLEAMSIGALEELGIALEREGIPLLTPQSQEPGLVQSLRFADVIVSVVNLPPGQRPFRIHVDPNRNGSEVVAAVKDRIRFDFYHRIGLDDLVTARSSL